jgi:hypothetical protein
MRTSGRGTVFWLPSNAVLSPVLLVELEQEHKKW